MIEAGLEKLIERYVREFTKDVRSLISQHERIVLETGQHGKYLLSDDSSRLTVSDDP